MPKMTKAQHAKYDKLRARLEAADGAIYATMYPRRDVPFSECYAASPETLRSARDDARDALIMFECEMIQAGRAWRASYGFRPNV